MSFPFVAEIRAFGFNFAPYQWAFCNGQPQQISQNETLYAIIGMIYTGAHSARPERELPTPGVVGACVTVVSFAVIALAALCVEGINRNAAHRKRSRDEPPDS